MGNRPESLVHSPRAKALLPCSACFEVRTSAYPSRSHPIDTRPHQYGDDNSTGRLPYPCLGQPPQYEPTILQHPPATACRFMSNRSCLTGTPKPRGAHIASLLRTLPIEAVPCSVTLDAIYVLEFPVLNDEVNPAVLSNRLQRDIDPADLLLGQSLESQPS